MSKLENKSLLTIEALNLLGWATQNDSFITRVKLPVKTMWNFKKNLNKLSAISDQYEEMNKEIESRYSDDEHSYLDTENGQELRKVKDEYIEEFSREKQELLLTKNDDINIYTFDIDEFGDIELDIQDMNMLEFFITTDDEEVIKVEG